jgi:Dolichyl-phosphate-mannose-protein mannosyltransferase
VTEESRKFDALFAHMTSSNDSTFMQAETVILAILLTAAVLTFTLHRLRRRRPDFAIGMPIVVGVGIRLIAIAGIASSGLQSALRGGDETTFLTWARLLANDPFGHGYYPHGHFPLHTVVFALQLKFGGFSEGALRVTQVGIATLGIVFLVAAVHDLAGQRAARITAWLLAIEPASIFFNSILHKEPLMELASGLMVFGASKVWRRLDLSGLVIMALAGFIAVKTRPYAGWFLISAGVLVVLHASLRRLDRPLRAMPLVYAVIIAGFIAAPAIVQVTSKKSLERLQLSQNANTDRDKALGTGGPNGNNLALEQVNFSTRGKVFANLPTRMLDVVIRPYPWQVSNASQQLGAVGSLFALTGFILLIGALWRRRGEVLALTGPILYPMIFLLSAYALSAGNAGTGFRYRTHLVTLGFAMLIALREGVAPAKTVPAPAQLPPLAERGRPVAVVQ